MQANLRLGAPPLAQQAEESSRFKSISSLSPGHQIALLVEYNVPYRYGYPSRYNTSTLNSYAYRQAETN